MIIQTITPNMEDILLLKLTNNIMIPVEEVDINTEKRKPMK
jgi:hypothetical protein